MNKEQVKELAEINATYTFDRATKQYGEFTDEYVRHFYNKLAELRGGIDDVCACNCQHNSNSRDNEPCCKCDSKQTNADRIRNMSDEELAKFLDIVEQDGISSQYTGVPCDCCYEKTECSKCWEEWLQSEAE
nr:MAG TPA: hypothetical protein [Caudoviricetes sp.]